MAEDSKRIQVNMSRKLRDLLRDWAAEVSKERAEEVGTGSIAGELLERLAQNPELVHQLLFQGEERKKASGKR